MPKYTRPASSQTTSDKIRVCASSADNVVYARTKSTFCQNGYSCMRAMKVTAELRYNEGLRKWQIMFIIMGFRCIEVLVHIFYCYWGSGK